MGRKVRDQPLTAPALWAGGLLLATMPLAWATPVGVMALPGEWLQGHLPVLGMVLIALAVLLRLGEVLVTWRDVPSRRLHRLIRRGAIVPEYQPVVCARTGRIRGVDVLARQHRSGGSVPLPWRVMALAARHGLPGQLMRRLVEQVAREVAGTPLPAGCCLSVSLSPACLADKELTDACRQLRQALARQQVSLTLVLTGRLPPGAEETLRARLSALRQEGMAVALGDFGGCRADWSALVNLPVDTLRLDTRFTDDVGQDGERAARQRIMIRHVNRMAEGLGMRVVAQGVTHPRQRDGLLREGIHWQQGELYAPPRPHDAFLQWLIAREGVARCPSGEPTDHRAGENEW
jgi:EAL domain-containing protein (putative c-di-GMP-specific phosphodiesterase class I)